MKAWMIMVFALSLASSAQALEVKKCADIGFTLSDVTDVKRYQRHGISIFEVNQIGLPHAPVGVAITFDPRSRDGAWTGDCLYVSGLSAVDISETRASLNPNKWTLTFFMPAETVDSEGARQNRPLKIVVDLVGRQPSLLQARLLK